MVRYHNRITNLKSSCLPYIVYMYELNSGITGWIEEIRIVTRLLHLLSPSLDIVYDAVESAILKLSQDRWWESALKMPKLCLYALFNSLDEPDVLVRSNLKR